MTCQGSPVGTRAECSCDPVSSTIESRSAQAPVDNDWVAPASADWWNRAEVELGVVARHVLFGCKVDRLLAASCDLAELVEVDSLRGGQHRARVALRSRHDERLRHVGRREVECIRLGDGALGARVREELIAHSRLVEHARQSSVAISNLAPSA